MTASRPLVVPATAVPMAAPTAALPAVFLPIIRPRSAPPTALPPMIAPFLAPLPSATLVRPAEMEVLVPSGATIEWNWIDNAPPVSLNPFFADFTSLIVPRTSLPAGNSTRSPTMIGCLSEATTESPVAAVSDVISAPNPTENCVPAGIVNVTIWGAGGTAAWAGACDSSGMALDRWVGAVALGAGAGG